MLECLQLLGIMFVDMPRDIHRITSILKTCI